jgi:hypothetical protein
MMFKFDSYWTSRCGSEIVYTRYADDSYFSTNMPNILSAILVELRAYLRGRASPALTINDRKTVFTSRKRKRLVTGLVLTSNREVSLGRDFKRKIKSMVFRHRLGLSDAKDAICIRGLLSYAYSVEPRFIASLEQKFKVHFKDLV